jgi:D-alanyl-D-alanine carboxypeptidase (penicillin-binding protein 5/6)
MIEMMYPQYPARLAKKPPLRFRFLRRMSLVLAVFMPLYIGWSWLAVPHSALAGASVVEQSLQVPNNDGTPALQWPGSGQAAIGTTAFGTLATHGQQTATPIASVAKVMAALSILKKHPFSGDSSGATITLTQKDVDIYNAYVAKDGSVALVAAGEQLSEYQALQALLLPSANNMADTLANWAFGSVEAYATYANDYAARLGLTQTHFVDASGYEPGTVSSASDLVKLGTLALKNEVIANIVKQRSAVLPVAGTVYNVNNLIGRNGFIGIKTGNTDQAGGCLLFASTHTVGSQKFVIVGAILGEANLSRALQSSAKLMDSAKRLFAMQTLASKGTTVATYRTPWGESSEVKLDDTLEAVSWNNGRIQQFSQFDTVRLPAATGQTVGKYIAVSTSTQNRDSVPMVLTNDIKGPSLWWRLLHPVKTWQLKFS